ncbi:DUF4438 domain-containing protein [Wenzhouxiangella sp. AB-CW3]|uniref:DUF4438 family protein n=1 Tax=Wenzhouxiangella sp. AB-CW3 TaxID=2771012 RepID=UPI00168A5029|nr:DUF4438 domain-containing protein [Wenzhouxiangella sp. AB-CW3]QOC23132.1 DUF4438 domain-containing protein [Wenzhouxiangella sp. AB-CW3]
MRKILTALTTLLLALPLVAVAELQPIEFNAEALVEQAVIGEISQPAMRESIYRVKADGSVAMVPGTGSITYNYRTGDSAVDMAGNHVEPAVSIYNLGSDRSRTGNDNRALNALSMIGNQVRIVSGEATGETGWVIGKHGGVEHVMVDFAPEVYDHLVIGDRMQVRTVGGGMRLTNVEDVRVFNASPDLIEALNANGAGVTAEGRLRVPVTHVIPAKIMGSGLGRDHVYTGDYDIQMFDDDVNERHNLNSLRFGDIVAISDADHSHGRTWLGGAISVGVVVHGKTMTAGHGPGVTTLFTSPSGNIELVEDAEANLKSLLEIP